MWSFLRDFVCIISSLKTAESHWCLVEIKETWRLNRPHKSPWTTFISQEPLVTWHLLYSTVWYTLIFITVGTRRAHLKSIWVPCVSEKSSIDVLWPTFLKTLDQHIVFGSDHGSALVLQQYSRKQTSSGKISSLILNKEILDLNYRIIWINYFWGTFLDFHL